MQVDDRVVSVAGIPVEELPLYSRSPLSLVQVAFILLWSILLLRFFLTFPRPKRVSRSRLATTVVYGSWVLFLGCLLLELIMHPALYHTFGAAGRRRRHFRGTGGPLEEPQISGN
jgi:hypothetical protein